MKLRDLLVLIDGSKRCQAVLALAIRMARQHDAHLTGICPLSLLFPFDPRFAVSEYAGSLAMRDALDQLETEAEEAARKLEADFHEQLRLNDVRGDWQVLRGAVAEAVARRARSSDLLVLGQSDPDNSRPGGARTLVDDVLMTAGRPLLIVPFAGDFPTIGTNVLIGWNGTREAARAVHDALLLIEPTAKVTVLTIARPRSDQAGDEVPGADLAEHLSRHSLNVSAARTVTDGTISEADALLAYSFDIGADLLVIGGYGHSRAREMILGGVSRHLLGEMTLPVLMSH
jgi:nucleotide-binding universal stress UspA family protein